MVTGSRRIAWGDVWWVETPALSRRPAVVMSRPEAIEVLPLAWIANLPIERMVLVSPAFRLP